MPATTWIFRAVAAALAGGGIALATQVNKPGSEPLAVMTAAIGIGLGAWVIGKHRADERKREHRDWVIKTTTEFITAANASGTIPAPSPATLINNPAKPLLFACSCRLLEYKKPPITPFIATRVKAGQLPIYIGARANLSREELAEAGVGEVGLTTKGITFASPVKSFDTSFDRITSIEVAIDAIKITMSGRAKPVVLQVPNGLLFGVLVKNFTAIRPSGLTLPPGAQIEISRSLNQTVDTDLTI